MYKQFVTNVTIMIYVTGLLGVTGVYINDLKMKNGDLTNKNEILMSDNEFLINSISYKENLLLEMEETFKGKESELTSRINELEQQLNDKHNEVNDLSNKVSELESQVKKRTPISRGDSGDTSLMSGNGVSLGQFKVTFYAPTDGSATGTTATGNKAIPYHTVAVDPNVIPLGTKLYIEGLGEAIADDVGGAIKGNILDYCVSSSSEAYSYGIKYLNVWIME